MTIRTRPLRPEDAEACDAIIASLPDFFDIEEGIRACAEAVRTEPGLVAEDEGAVRSFVAFARRFDASAEITWMATHADRRRRGLGGALIEELATILAAEGRRMLLVFTLSPNDPHDDADGYGSTRRFYGHHGFVPALEIPELWASSLALLLVRPLVAVSAG